MSNKMHETYYPPWNLISSEPDIFTDMISRYGVRDILVQDVLTLDNLLDLPQTSTFGIILAQQYQEDRLPDNIEEDDSDAKEIIFCSQLIVNSCATITILNILFNTDIEKGKLLDDFLEYTDGFDSINRGLALANVEEIRRIHNSYNANETIEEEEEMGYIFEDDCPEQKVTRKVSQKETIQETQDNVYHFIGYIFKNGFIWELDGLKKYPLKLVKVPENENWLNVLKCIVNKKIESTNLNANILAVLKDPVSIKEGFLRYLSDEIQELSNRLPKGAFNEPGSNYMNLLSSNDRIIFQKKREVEEQMNFLKAQIFHGRAMTAERMSKVDQLKTDYFPYITEMINTSVNLGIKVQDFQYSPSGDITHYNIPVSPHPSKIKSVKTFQYESNKSQKVNEEDVNTTSTNKPKDKAIRKSTRSKMDEAERHNAAKKRFNLRK